MAQALGRARRGWLSHATCRVSYVYVISEVICVRWLVVAAVVVVVVVVVWRWWRLL